MGLVGRLTGVTVCCGLVFELESCLHNAARFTLLPLARTIKHESFWAWLENVGISAIAKIDGNNSFFI